MTTRNRHRIVASLAILFGCSDPTDRDRAGDPIVQPPPPPPRPDTGVASVPGPTGPVDDAAPIARIVVIADYGSASDNEAAVAALVDSLAPDAVMTAGDNVYDTSDGHDERIGQFYQQYIAPYAGAYGEGSPDGVNRFWPCLGNHDWDAGIDEWSLFFELPGNERYWSVLLGVDPDTGGPLVEWFCVDSDVREPDGNDPTSVQAEWLRAGLAASAARWKLVGFHHPAWSSGIHGDALRLQWPFQQWGADLVVSGHDHLYEKLVRDGFVHLTDGRGGMSLYRTIGRTVWSEQVYDAAYGALVLDIGADTLEATSLTTDSGIVDELMILGDRPFSPDTHLVRFHEAWRYQPASGIVEGWEERAFDDTAWSVGLGQLGHGEGDEATKLPTVPANASWYFRYAFDVGASVPTAPLELTLIRDDGAAVYLNGVEILRDNLPAGDLEPDDLAVVDLTLATVEEEPVVVAVSPALLVAGRNVLAVEVHHAGTGTLDLSFDLALRALESSRLIAEGSTWSYREAAPLPGWQQPAFDVSAWAVGPAPLGYGHVVLGTLLAEGDPLVRPPAAWFSQKFEVADADAISALWLSFLRDDGLVVWLNGREVHRTNMPAGPPSATAYALAEAGVEWADVWSGTFIDRSGLATGTNTLAVEVHQGAAAGVDLRFDLRLIGLD